MRTRLPSMRSGAPEQFLAHAPQPLQSDSSASTFATSSNRAVLRAMSSRFRLRTRRSCNKIRSFMFEWKMVWAACICILACGGRVDSDPSPEFGRSSHASKGGAAGATHAGAGGSTETAAPTSPGGGVLVQTGGTLGAGGQAPTGGTTTGSGGQTATGGSSNPCQLPNGSCAPGCYNLDPCFFEGCPPNCVPSDTRACGNGRMEPPETCDDGNVMSGDGCSSICTGPEPGFVCPLAGKRCRQLCVGALDPSDAGTPEVALCGNGIVECGEDCDDGLNDGGYGGCRPDCLLAPYCGDGITHLQFGESCDDGINDGSYGGCAPDCNLGPYCGDWIVQSRYGEECDTGLQPALPCTSNCRIYLP
jgi:cysteine-rich repeat protein